MNEFRFCPRCASELGTRTDSEGKVRRACQTAGCGFVHWDNPVPVVAAIVEYDGRILLARNAAAPAGRFALIAGFMERDESPEQAVLRELAEETSLQAEAPLLVGVYEFIRKNELIIVYHVRAHGTIALSAELAEYRLVEPIDLRPWRAGTGPALADWMRARGLPVQFVDFPGAPDPAPPPAAL